MKTRWAVIYILLLATTLFEGDLSAQMHVALIKGHSYISSGIAAPDMTIQISQNEQLIKTIKTNEDGYFEFGGLAPGKYKVTIVEFNVLNNEKEISLTADEQLTLDLLVKFHPRYEILTPKKIYGLIQDQNKTPVAKAVIKLISPFDQSLISKTISDTHGQYLFTIKADRLEQMLLCVYKSGFTASVKLLNIKENKEIKEDFTLSLLK
jgi:hypothetical protein